MTLKTIERSIEINATAERVWKVLPGIDYIKKQYTAFGEGIEAKTDWSLGGKAALTDQKGDGMIGRIVTHEPNKKIIIEYDGFMAKGQKDLTSEGTLITKGSQETYTLAPAGNGIMLTIKCEMDDNYFDMMSAMWDNALQKIKQLSESDQ